MLTKKTQKVNYEKNFHLFDQELHPTLLLHSVGTQKMNLLKLSFHQNRIVLQHHIQYHFER